MASAASPSARSASLAAALASSCCARLSILALTSSILAAASAFICAHLLLGVLDGQVHVDLGLVDSLPELVTGLAGGSLRRRFRVRDVLLERVQLCGEVHDPSLPCVDCWSCCSQRRALAAGASTLPASGRWSWPGGPSKMGRSPLQVDGAGVASMRS